MRDSYYFIGIFQDNLPFGNGFLHLLDTCDTLSEELVFEFGESSFKRVGYAVVKLNKEGRCTILDFDIRSAYC